MRYPVIYAAINSDPLVREQSSSGGVFYLLAEYVVSHGGIVFGARFDASWDVIHDWTDCMDGIAPFMGSKYVQSRIGDAYQKVKEFLSHGRLVLFSGTPCQIVGLKAHLPDCGIDDSFSA